MMNTYDWWVAKLRAIRHSKPPEPPMRVRLHEAGHAVAAHRFGYVQQGIMLREDDTGETSQQYATGMDDDMSVRLQTEIIISMTGFAVTLEYPEYKTDALRIGGDVQMELVNAAIIHRIDPAMGSADEIMDTLWVRARLVARNNKPLIQAVAARLDHYGFWTGEEIQRIIDDCEKGAGPMSVLEWPADLTRPRSRSACTRLASCSASAGGQAWRPFHRISRPTRTATGCWAAASFSACSHGSWTGARRRAGRRF